MDIGYKILKSVGDKIGDGLAASGGMAGMAKMIPKSAPMPVKALGIFGGAAGGVIGKRTGQAFSDVAFSSTGTGTGTGASTGTG